MNNDSDDRDFFRKAMGDVRPLRNDRAERKRPQPPPEARFAREDRKQVLRESLTGPGSPDEHEEMSFLRPEVSRQVLRKLRRGRYSIADELDLHGLNATDARKALDDFLAEAALRGHSCVRIVHGKGTRSGLRGPVLKPKVARWLRQRRQVLAYTTARPVDGGSGALYVLLAS